MCGAMIRHKPLQRHNLDVQHWFTAKFAYQSIIDMVCIYIYIILYIYSIIFFLKKKKQHPKNDPKTSAPAAEELQHRGQALGRDQACDTPIHFTPWRRVARNVGDVNQNDGCAMR